MAMDSELSAFSAWSLLSLTATAHGVLAYPDELGVRYVYDNTVPNGRYVAVGDLAVIRDNRYVLGAGWIDSIEESGASKIRYRCPDCGSTDFKHRSTQRFAYRCAKCGTEFNDNDRREEELTVQVFTANYSRTFRLADRPFPVKALDPAYIARSQQNAIRRLDPAALRPVLEKYLVTGEPWWETRVREEERIPGGRGVGLSKTRVGQQRFREAMLDRFGEACAFTGPQPPGALQAAHLYLYSANPEHDLRGGLLLRCDLHALFDRWLVTIDPSTWSIEIAPELKRYPGLAELDGRAIQLPEDLRPRLKYIQEHAALAHASWR
jgi:DNA-directed RNA polymerase subunit RPC12/RpoP